jgi:hypothetical protein
MITKSELIDVAVVLGIIIGGPLSAITMVASIVLITEHITPVTLWLIAHTTGIIVP